MKLTDERKASLQEAVDLVEEHGSGYAASKVSDVAANTLNDRNKLGRELGIKPQTEYKPAPTQELTDSSTMYDGDGNIRLQWVKTKKSKELQKQALLNIIDEFKNDLPKLKPRKAPALEYSKELMAVIPFGDPHFGLYCWEEETGADFDIEMAATDLCGAVHYLVNQSPATERCLILNLGDFFHSDNNLGTTTKGTRLDTDTRLAKVVRIGVRAIRTAIETALQRHKVVEIVNSIGNHDETLSMCLSVLLAEVYRDEPRVIVHDNPTKRHYIQHGKVLIGVTHGDKGKDADLPGLMATERPKLWGETQHRYFYKGHLHHDFKKEYNGAVLEMFRTLAPNDMYAVSGGWLSGQDMKMIVHHAEYGEVSRSTVSLNMLRDMEKNK